MNLFYAEILLVIVLGTLLHFTYGWSGKNPLVGLVAPVNESVWEHMKMLFFPMLLTGLWNLRRETDPCVISAFHGGLLLGTALIPAIFYGYKRILGRHYLVLDIADFIIAVFLAFVFYRFFSNSCLLGRLSHIMTGAVILLLICFCLFTYRPPDFPMFRGPHK